MLSSISPFGERARNSRWWLTVLAYLVGSIAGGATMGLVFGGLGQVIVPLVSARTGLAALAVVAIAGVAADLGWLGLRVPTTQRQVNEDWLTTYRGWVYGSGFGFQLGLGLVTIVASSTVWLTWVAAAMVGSWVGGLALGVVFGTARGAFILTTAGVDEPARLRRLFASISANATVVHRLAVTVAALTAVTATAGLA